MFVMNGHQRLKIEPMNKITEGLWLGDHIACSNKFILARGGITHILTIAAGMYPKFPTKYVYKTINEYDVP
jgi:hypothetical protein